MFRKNSNYQQLEFRKKLLLAESEINRDQLLKDITTLKSEGRSLIDHAFSLYNMLSTATTLMTGLSALLRNKPAHSEEAPSWIQTIIKGAGTVAQIWRTFHTSRSDSRNK